MKTIAIAASLYLLVAGITLCSAAVVTVDCEGGGDFSTIQAAIDASADGDTIRVMPCVYSEHVSLVNRDLTLVGSGLQSTTLYWDGPTPALTVDNTESSAALPDRAGCTVTGFTIEHADNGSIWSRPAVRVLNGVFELADCMLVHAAFVASDPYNWFADADILASGCDIDFLRVWGQDHHTSSVNNCRIGWLGTSGGSDPSGASSNAVVFTADSVIGELDMTGGTVFSERDSTALITLFEGSSAHSAFLASGGAFGLVDALTGGGRLEILASTFDTLSYYAVYSCSLRVRQSLVRHGIDMYGFDDQIDLAHNTFLSPVHLVIGDGWGTSDIASNIFVGELTGEAAAAAVFRNNDFVAGSSLTGGVFTDNISEDPLFCDAAGADYSLQDCSPCVGAAHDGGDIGAFPIGCECIVAVERRSWGAIKGLYR
jgi:hypothetical protein